MFFLKLDNFNLKQVLCLKTNSLFYQIEVYEVVKNLIIKVKFVRFIKYKSILEVLFIDKIRCRRSSYINIFNSYAYLFNLSNTKEC